MKGHSWQRVGWWRGVWCVPEQKASWGSAQHWFFREARWKAAVGESILAGHRTWGIENYSSVMAFSMCHKRWLKQRDFLAWRTCSWIKPKTYFISEKNKHQHAHKQEMVHKFSVRLTVQSNKQATDLNQKTTQWCPPRCNPLLNPIQPFHAWPTQTQPRP